jgi:hypothetical protein
VAVGDGATVGDEVAVTSPAVEAVEGEASAPAAGVTLAIVGDSAGAGTVTVGVPEGATAAAGPTVVDGLGVPVAADGIMARTEGTAEPGSPHRKLLNESCRSRPPKAMTTITTAISTSSTDLSRELCLYWYTYTERDIRS